MRLPLNSEALFQNNKQLYKNFLSNYPVVVSAPGGIILAGAFSHQFGGIGIHKRIPLRNYIGVKEIISDDKIEIISYESLDIFQKNFSSQHIDHDISSKLEYFKEKLVAKGYKKGLRIGFLNELPRRCGLNNPGVNAANLAMLYLYLTKQIDCQFLNEFISNKLTGKKQEFISDTIKEFHQVLIGPNNSGFGALSCFIDSPMPIIYQTKDGINIKTLDQIFPGTSGISPFDFTIVGTSDRSDIDFSLAKYDHISENLSISENSFEKIESADFLLKDKANSVEEFSVINDFRQAINASTVLCLGLLGQSWERPTSENLNACLEAFNNSFNSLNLIGSNFKRKNKVANFVQNFFYKNLPDTPFALTTSIANNLVIITIREHFRPYLTRLKQFLDESLDFEISWPYISWIDGSREQGARIDQSISEGVHCDKLPENSLIIKEIGKLDTYIDVKYIDLKEDLIGKYDLIFDADDKKIYIGNRKIDSKDLPTTTRTCELFSLVLDSENLKIDNKNLPDVSYFADRNELQSKIISPLKILVEKELGVIFNLKITGQITNFTISYYPSNLKIGLIKRV